VNLFDLFVFFRTIVEWWGVLATLAGLLGLLAPEPFLPFVWVNGFFAFFIDSL
jgi:hypothetical protein